MMETATAAAATTTPTSPAASTSKVLSNDEFVVHTRSTDIVSVASPLEILLLFQLSEALFECALNTRQPDSPLLSTR